MRDVTFYRDRANELLCIANSAWAKRGEKDSEKEDSMFITELTTVTMDFIHLVYAYDPQLPLNKYIENLKSCLYIHNDDDRNKPYLDSLCKYITYFTKYLEDYDM